MTDLINSDRLWARVDRLSRMTLPDAPWTRRAFTPLFSEARIWLTEQMTQAGLAATLDAGGNLIGRRRGRRSDLAPIVAGSHCDTVAGGGRYDGIIGVLAGIEIAHVLHEQGIVLRHPFEVIDFLSEEPSDYGISCVGSRAFSGALDAGMLSAKNAQGETLADAMRRIGARPEELGKPLRRRGGTAAYVELHIEQGPVLERRRLPIGVVTHIVGVRRTMATVVGQPDHAGATPMGARRDALVGAAHVIEQTYRAALRQSGDPHYVAATVGRIAATPNAPNAVPGKVEMMLDVRSDDQRTLDVFPEQTLERCGPFLRKLNLQTSLRHVSRASPIACSETVMQAVGAAAESLGLPSLRLPSGAGHDAVHVAPTGPVGMVFIPCAGGRSHCPEESISQRQLTDGAKVLARALLNLDKALS